MSPFRKISLAILMIAAFLSVPEASAHRPEEGVARGVTVIPDPTTSFAYYREFGSGEFVHVYSVEGAAGQAFHAGINIPQLEGLENYGVTLAVFGPGLTELDPARLPDDLRNLGRPSTVPALPVSTGAARLPDLTGMGGVILESAVTEDFYEPFTQTSYWGRQSVDLTFPETGTYYLAVWQPEETAGKYVMDTGRQEVFSPADLFRFPVWWWETRAYFNQLPSPWAGAGIGLALLAGLVLLRRRAAHAR